MDADEAVKSESGAVDFRPGDIVNLKLSIMKQVKHRFTTPRVLIEAGWPNQFRINNTFESPEGEPCLSLDPCCFWMRDRKGGGFLCKGHQVHLFEKFDEAPKRPRGKDDRYASITTPWGPLFEIESIADDKEPGLTLKVGNNPIVLTGGMARQVAQVLKQAGILT